MDHIYTNVFDAYKSTPLSPPGAFWPSLIVTAFQVQPDHKICETHNKGYQDLVVEC